MTWVKVCGLSTHEALSAAEAAGADAVGFVLVPSSPRVVTAAVAARLAAASVIDTYVLTSDVEPDDGLALLADLGVTGVQPYGEAHHAFAEAALASGYRVLFPVPVSDGADLDPGGVPTGAIPLFDRSESGKPGGTGRTFDWNVLTEREPPYVVAGGLGPDNVADLVGSFRPWGVDASSRLESSPGIKDVDSIRAFVRAAKDA